MHINLSDEQLKELIQQYPSTARWDSVASALRERGFHFRNSRFTAAWNSIPRPIDLQAGRPTPFVDAEEAIRQLLLRHRAPVSYLELAETLSLPIDLVVRGVERLAAAGMNLSFSRFGVEVESTLDVPKIEVIDTSTWANKVIRLGVTSDNHLGSRYARLDVLNALFDIWHSQGITEVYQCGNIIDGEFFHNKHDLLVHGIKGQVDYLIDNWPQREGMVTKFITGDDHEGWYIQREGIDIGRHIESEAKLAGRSDLIYLGHMEKTIDLRSGEGSALMSLIHGGGGTAYAVSYSVQKIVESYQGGEKPNILLVGHYHKFEYGYPREVHAIQVGTTEDQTPFMRKKKIQAMVGGVTVEFTQDEKGIVHNFRVTWNPFFDRNFYKGEGWKYHWSK